MGYTTDFAGWLDITPALKPEHEAYINAFSGTRRMTRAPAKTAKLPDPLREAVGLPVGEGGGYFVGAIDPEAVPDEGDRPWGTHAGQQHTADILDHNEPPPGQPGLWCQWVVGTNNGKSALEWDGGEKFYNYVEWLGYLIEHFFDPWGYTLDGEITWQGEDSEDIGIIRVDGDEGNEVRVGHARITYEF